MTEDTKKDLRPFEVFDFPVGCMGDLMEDTVKIKVFRINDYEWWAAETLEQAIAAAKEQSGEDEVADDPCELSDHQLDFLQFRRDDGTSVSFREELKSQIENMTNESFPHLFASTDF